MAVDPQQVARAFLEAPIEGWTVNDEVRARRAFERAGHLEVEWDALEEWQRGAWRREVHEQ